MLLSILKNDSSAQVCNGGKLITFFYTYNFFNTLIICS